MAKLRTTLGFAVVIVALLLAARGLQAQLFSARDPGVRGGAPGPGGL